MIKITKSPSVANTRPFNVLTLTPNLVRRMAHELVRLACGGQIWGGSGLMVLQRRLTSGAWMSMILEMVSGWSRS